MTRYGKPPGQCLAHSKSSKTVSCLLSTQLPPTHSASLHWCPTVPPSFLQKLPLLTNKPSSPTTTSKAVLTFTQHPVYHSHSRVFQFFEPSRKCCKGASLVVSSTRWSLKNNSRGKMSVVS